MPAADNMFHDLRGRALATRPSDLGIPESLSVYGALLELGMGDDTATVVCFITGDASLYYSTGGGIIGGSGIPSVSAAAIRMVHVFADLVDLLPVVESVAVPGDGRAGFVALTTSGLRSVSGSVMAIETDGTDLTPLYAAGQDVISAFRLSAGATTNTDQQETPPGAPDGRRGRWPWRRRRDADDRGASSNE